tara:strand:+ start:845 stop:2062 length:1218 start_codon:yes stop_codon:yes gene_type:complete
VIKKSLETRNNIQKEHLDNFSLSKFSKIFKNLEKETKEEINNSKKTLNVLSKSYKFNFKVKELRKFKKYKTVVIIGMGGSILGAESLYNFFKFKIKKKFYFFDDLISQNNFFFKKKGLFKKTLFIIISKSGNTIETLSNLLNLNILKNHSNNIIVITEKKNNPLYLISKKFNLFYIEHKINIGGRYSVLSEVGIIPAFLMGLNIPKIRSNILNFLKGSKKNFLKDSVVKLSNLIKKNRVKNIIFLNYAPELEKFLFWCQQLIAESLGKKNKGFMPVISNVPKDHHSLLQLYLDGPKDKLFYIFYINSSTPRRIQSINEIKDIAYLSKKKISEIKYAQKNALIKTLKNKNLPFREFNITSINESIMGELFSYFILETVLIGKLLKINPFNQPAVEQVKIITKKLLN